MAISNHADASRPWDTIGAFPCRVDGAYSPNAPGSYGRNSGLVKAGGHLAPVCEGGDELVSLE